MEILEVVFTIFVGLLTIFLVGVGYLVTKWTYWKRLNVASPPILEVAKEFFNLAKFSYYKMDMEARERFGNIYGIYFGLTPMLMVSDPEILKHILVKDFNVFKNRRHFNMGAEVVDKTLPLVEGDDWKRIRSVITPTFSSGKIKKTSSLLQQCSKTLVNNVKIIAEGNDPKIDIKIYSGTFAMDVIASVAFGTKIDSHQDPENPFVQNAKKIFTSNFNWRFLLGFLFPSVFKWLGINMLNENDGRFFFEKTTRQIIQQRKHLKEHPHDFLQLLLDAQAGKVETESSAVVEESDSQYQVGEESHAIFKSSGKKTISEIELIAQCVLFFMGAYDSSSTTISSTVYCMALNPDIQEKLYQEICEAFGDSEDLDLEVLNNLEYLSKVISETLRLHPPGSRMERRAEEDYKIPGQNFSLKKGQIVMIPVYAMHHDPEIYPDPETFDPERFSPENKATRNPYNYLPFGAGPRNCVARRFALMEVKIVLVNLFRNFRFYRVPETKVPLEYNFGTGVHSPLNVTVGVEIRNAKR